MYLTKGPTLSELNRTSGAFVSVRGRYLDVVEKARIPRCGSDVICILLLVYVGNRGLLLFSSKIFLSQFKCAIFIMYPTLHSCAIKLLYCACYILMCILMHVLICMHCFVFREARPLYLHVQGSTRDKVDGECAMLFPLWTFGVQCRSQVCRKASCGHSMGGRGGARGGRGLGVILYVHVIYVEFCYHAVGR